VSATELFPIHEQLGLKTIFLIRHAKSSWDSAALSDFDRPLNDRGKKDAPEMANRLLENKIRIDLFVSSPAKRARKTAAYFSKVFGKKEDKILLVPELYQADPAAFYLAISGLENKYDHVAIFSHNPGITDFANSLTDTQVDDMPTCSIFCIKVFAEKWKNFEDARKEFLFFDFPKSKSGNEI